MFFKNLIFPYFRLIKPVARLIEIAIKNLVRISLAWSLLDWCWINRICFSINRTYFSTNRKSVWEFFKNISFSRVLHYFKTFQKAFWLFLFDRSNSSKFLSFSLVSQGFCCLAPVRPFYPFLFSLISFFMHLRGNFEPIGIWDFFCFWDVFCPNWSMGFCSKMM